MSQDTLRYRLATQLKNSKINITAWVNVVFQKKSMTPNPSEFPFHWSELHPVNFYYLLKLRRIWKIPIKFFRMGFSWLALRFYPCIMGNKSQGSPLYLQFHLTYENKPFAVSSLTYTLDSQSNFKQYMVSVCRWPHGVPEGICIWCSIVYEIWSRPLKLMTWNCQLPIKDLMKRRTVSDRGWYLKERCWSRNTKISFEN